MIRKAVFLAVLTGLTLACSSAPEETAETRAPLYVDVTGGGHGPFTCAGDVPLRGYIDIRTASGACQRVRGDFAAPGHPGYVVSGFQIPAAMTSMTMSTHELGHTYGYACHYPATGPASTPCQGQSGQDVSYFNNQSFPVSTFQWQPAAIVLGYDVTCPVTTTWNHFQAGTGAQTPEDGSGLPTARITDDFGHALNAPNGTSPAGDCAVDVHTLQPNWYGCFVAVYTF